MSDDDDERRAALHSQPWDAANDPHRDAAIAAVAMAIAELGWRRRIRRIVRFVILVLVIVLAGVALGFLLTARSW